MKLRSAFLTCLLLLLSNLLFSQGKKMSVAININLKVDTFKTRVYQLPKHLESENVKTIVLKMKYGETEILNPGDARELDEIGCNIISVDIVYTDFGKKDVQDKLNRKRISELYFLSPGVFSQSLTQWKYIEQLGYASEEDAKKLFHGIVVKYLKIPPYKPPTLKSMLADIMTSPPKDTTVLRVFHKYPNYTSELICVDLTGSMSPFYFQVFSWMLLKKGKAPMNFSFFNDGDLTPDFAKKTGNVGGVYFCSSASIDTIMSSAFLCISSGNGGDTPENNVEAILKGIKKYPELNEIVLIADNWADMRDYSLMTEIKKPVRVILCGTDLYGIKSSVNPQYLDLAKKTGGSVHTIEEDIMKLAEKKEGEEITVGGEKFVFRAGRFTKK